MKNNVCIITARGGSKRIPKKNIKEFCGKPIIAYSIEAAIESGMFCEVMVSTDDEEIAEISKSYGASVPFMRDEKTSDDYASTADVLREVLERYEETDVHFDNFCCVYPTAPFVSASKLRDSGALLFESVRAVVPVVQFSFPPQRAFRIKNECIELIDTEAFKMRSQDLEPIYHDCGQFYWGKVDLFLRTGELIPKDTKPFVVPEMEVQDIDNLSDWELAELKFKSRVSK